MIAPIHLRVEPSKNRIHIATPYTLAPLCKALPGRRWDPRSKTWHVPATPAAAREIRRVFAAHWSDATVDQTFNDLLDEANANDDQAQYKDADNLPDVPCSATTAWGHQLQAFWFGSALRAVMLDIVMGAGKTKICVDLINHWNADRVLILAPAKVVRIWPKQFRVHSCRPPTMYELSQGSVASKAAAVAEALDRPISLEGPTVIAINYESAWREPLRTILLDAQWDVVVLDESHKIKAPGGKSSQFCERLGHRATHRMCLTGTPMPHSPLDIYAQYRFLDPGVFGTSFVAFRNRYAIMGGYENRQVVNYQNEDELSRKFHSIAYHAGEEVLDLPPLHDIVRTTTLKPAAAKLYRELDNDFIAYVDDQAVSVANALTELLRLAQVTSGFVRDDDKNDHEIDSAKAELFEDLLDGFAVEEKIVVFTRFKWDCKIIEAIATKQGRRYGEVSGTTNDLTIDSDFPDDVDVLAVQIQSGGAGIDLSKARYAIYYALGFSLGDYEQSRKRVHRPGQTRATTYYHLIVENSVDEKVYGALSQRKSVVEYIMGLARGAEQPVPLPEESE